MRQAWRVDFTDADGVRQRRQFKSKREAYDFRVDLEVKLRLGTFRRRAEKTTVKDICIAYLEYAEGRNQRGERYSRAHLQAITGHVWNYICPDPVWRANQPATAVKPFTQGIANVKLSQLSRKGVSAFRDRLRDAGVGVILTRRILTNLHTILAYAIEQDADANNAAHNVRVIGRHNEGAKKVTPPSKDAMKAILSIAPPDFRLKLIVAAATAVRAGEFHALRWRHLDFEFCEFTIETRVDAWRKEDVTKTEAGMRTIPLAASVVKALQQWRQKTVFNEADDLIFPNGDGTYVHHGNMVKRAFKPLFAQLARLHTENPKLYPKVKPFNWHALRHYGISTWIAEGFTPKAVQTFAGHRSLATTMDRYGHLFKSDDHRKKMDNIGNDLIQAPKPRERRSDA